MKCEKCGQPIPQPTEGQIVKAVEEYATFGVSFSDVAKIIQSEIDELKKRIGHLRQDHIQNYASYQTHCSLFHRAAVHKDQTPTDPPKIKDKDGEKESPFAHAPDDKGELHRLRPGRSVIQYKTDEDFIGVYQYSGNMVGGDTAVFWLTGGESNQGKIVPTYIYAYRFLFDLPDAKGGE